jgi:hypothetical protein
VPGAAAILATAAKAPAPISTADAAVASLRCDLNMMTTFRKAYLGPTSGLVFH